MNLTLCYVVIGNSL